MTKNHDLFMTVILQNQVTGLTYRALRFALGATDKEMQELIYKGTVDQEITCKTVGYVTLYRVLSTREYRAPLRMVPSRIFRLYVLLHENPDGVLFSDLSSYLGISRKKLAVLIDEHEVDDFLQYITGPDKKVRTLLTVHPSKLVRCMEPSWWERFIDLFWS